MIQYTLIAMRKSNTSVIIAYIHRATLIYRPSLILSNQQSEMALTIIRLLGVMLHKIPGNLSANQQKQISTSYSASYEISAGLVLCQRSYLLLLENGFQIIKK